MKIEDKVKKVLREKCHVSPRYINEATEAMMAFLESLGVRTTKEDQPKEAKVFVSTPDGVQEAYRRV